MEKAIGGYFELELPQCEEFHKNALRLNSGKNCLEYILRARSYNKVYIPYYTCDVVLRPFEKLKISYEFYHIDIHLELAQEITLKEGESLLYTNYFGLKQQYVEFLAKKFGSQLIVDNTQAFFAQPIDSIDTFYTCRKFFGVSDGAYLFTDASPIKGIQRSVSFNRTIHLIKRIDLSSEAGFDDFHQVEKELADDEIMLMSIFTERMMQSINYKKAANQRRTNYKHLHKHLQSMNLLQLPMDIDSVPMVYPFMTDREDLRQYLIQNKIFVANYWPNVIREVRKKCVEFQLAKKMVPLPIDQRYSLSDMDKIIDIIKK